MFDNVLNDVVSYVLLGIPIVATGMGLPIPEELLVIGAGVASHNQLFEPWAALLTCIVAAILGDCSMYAIGYHGHAWLRSHPRFARLFNPRLERKMERKIRQHGLKALFIARFLVGVRSPVYVAAGILRVPFRYFIVCDLISASVVVSFFFGLSYLFAEQINNLWARIQKAEIALTVTVVATVIGVVIYFYVRRRRRLDRIRLRRLRRPRGPRGQQPPSASTAHSEEPSSNTSNKEQNNDAHPGHDSSGGQNGRTMAVGSQPPITRSVA